MQNERTMEGGGKRDTGGRPISRFDMSLRRSTGSGQNRYATKTS